MEEQQPYSPINVTTIDGSTSTTDRPNTLVWATFDSQSLDLKVWLSYGEDRTPAIEHVCVEYMGDRSKGVLDLSYIGAFDRSIGRWSWWLLEDLDRLEHCAQPDMEGVDRMKLHRWGLIPG